jgi:RimJ/RimL family protein N-acetyltransferase
VSEQLRTARLLLRRWREEDKEPFAALNADPVVMEHFPSTLTREESDALVERIEGHFGEHGYGLWAVETDGAFVGFTGLSWARFDAPFTPALEVGWRLARSAWGRGYATEAATAAVQRGLQEVDSVVSFTAAVNARSERVMQRIGMRREGEFDHPRLPPGDRLARHVLYRTP